MRKKTNQKKKTQTKSLSSVKKIQKKEENENIYVVLIRSWTFIVLFAFMLGIGVIVGNYISGQINGYPTVAGASITR